jgi:dihydrofolate synthase/folylpolyglutamate synthase
MAIITLEPLSLAEAEAEIHAHIFSRSAEQDHEAKMRRVAKALDYLGDPQDDLRVIHVTGTNGKTSTSRMAASLLSAHGLKVGMFTSPHLHTLRERIQVGGVPLDQAELVRLWHIVAPAIHRVDAYSARIGGPRMSFFEVLTVLGLVAFSTARVDVAVIEVGIGGARDATNVCEGEVAVLTPMGIDHSEYFGGTIEGVAREKTGIIKSHATVVTAVQADEVATIVTAVARRASATPIWEGAQMSVISSESVPGGQLMTLATAADTYPDLFLPMHGAFQVHNALLALAAVEAFLGRGVPCSLDARTVAAGFASASSPGRLEVVAHAPLVVLDAAHNPHGVAALAGGAREVLGDRDTVGVIAVLADKDVRGILEGVSSLVERVVVTRTSSERALSVDDLERVAIDILGAHRVQRAPDVSLAIAKARDLAGPEGAVLVTGSITLVAQARHVLGMTLRGLGQAGDAAAVAA